VNHVIKKLLGINDKPLTYRDVAPAPRDEEKERQIKNAQAELVDDMLKVGRTSWQIRQELVGNVINIISGDDR
jgi:hypothetical protein